MYHWTPSSGLSGFSRFTFRNYKQILLELERLYDLVIDVEDCEKKLMALPTNTAMRTQVEREKEQAVARLGPALAVESRYIKRRTSSNYPLGRSILIFLPFTKMDTPSKTSILWTIIISTVGSFLPNCTFFTPQYGLPLRKNAV